MNEYNRKVKPNRRRRGSMQALTEPLRELAEFEAYL